MQEQINQLLCLTPDKRIKNYTFSMQAVIGRGSYGIVYVGRQSETGQCVALKVVPIPQLQSDKLTLIQKEIDIMRDLDSQNVVKLIEVVQTENNFYIISELCSGGDLKEYMKRYGALDENVALPIITQILKGILQTFKKGIIHRDLKPANILIAHQDQNVLFKIADFGFAKRFKHLENELMNSLVGTPLYMSPQVLLRRLYTSKCDVWSVGLIYYQLLEGRMPWSANDIVDLINQQRSFQLSYKNRVSLESQQFILGCLQYDEPNRLNWEQLFTHSVFQGIFQIQQNPQLLRSQSDRQNHSQERQGIIKRKSVSPPKPINKPTLQLKVNGQCKNIMSNQKRIGEQPTTTKSQPERLVNIEQQGENSDGRCKEILTNYIQFNNQDQSFVNKQIVKQQIAQIKYLQNLLISLSNLYPLKTPLILKFRFLLSKLAMITDSKLYKDGNFLALEINDQLEKQIVENHFEIFNQFQDDFLYLNENLSMVINDPEFQDIFNNNLEVDISPYASNLTAYFIKEHINTPEDTNLNKLRFHHSILLFYEQIKNHSQQYLLDIADFNESSVQRQMYLERPL